MPTLIEITQALQEAADTLVIAAGAEVEARLALNTANEESQAAQEALVAAKADLDAALAALAELTS